MSPKARRRVPKIIVKPIRFMLEVVVFSVEKFPRFKHWLVMNTYQTVPWLYDYIDRSFCAGFSTLIADDRVVISGAIHEISNSHYVAQNQPGTVPLPRGKRILYLYVDHTVLYDSNTGIQRVTRGVANSLSRLGERICYVKWGKECKSCVLINFRERENLARWDGPGITREEKELYTDSSARHVPIGNHDRQESHWLIVPEVPNFSKYETSLMKDIATWSKQAGLRLGAIFYDAIPLKREEYIHLAPMHLEYMQGLILADVVWPISQWSNMDLLAYWEEFDRSTNITIPESEVILLPGESNLSSRVTTILSSEKIILCVGSIEPRKNQLMLIDAFCKYKRNNPGNLWKLVLVGKIYGLLIDRINHVIKQNVDIDHKGYISDPDLDELYRLCSFTVFPSIEEGFGLPIMESIWYGKPCICANFGAMREVGEDGGCLMVDTSSFDSLYSALVRMINDEKLRRELSEQAMKRKITSWEDYAITIQNKINQKSVSPENFN